MTADDRYAKQESTAQPAAPARDSGGGQQKATKATQTERGRAQLEKARAYKDADGDGTRAGYAAKQEALHDAATKGTSAEFAPGILPGYLGGSNDTAAGSAARNTIEEYLTSGQTSSEQTSRFLDEATGNADKAATENEQMYWLDMASTLQEQLDADQKREKDEKSFSYQAFNRLLNQSAPPQVIPIPKTAAEKAKEQGQEVVDPAVNALLESAKPAEGPEAEQQQTAQVPQQEPKTSDRLEELLRQYNEALPNYETSATAANAVTSLEREIAAENRALGNDPYYGLDENAQNRQGAGGFAKGLASGLNAFAGTTLLAADMAIYNPDLHPEMQDEQLVELMGERDRLNDRINALAAGEDGTATAEERPSIQEQADAAWERWQTTFAPEDYAEFERLQAMLGSDESAEDTENLTEQLEAVEAQIRARREELGLGPEEEMPESNSVLGEKGWSMLQYGADMAEAGNQDWANYLEGMSETERFIANVAKTGGEMVFDMTANVILPGSGTIMMAARKGGGRAIDQLGKENDDRGSIALACFTGAGTAYLSERLVGGAELAYNKSLFGSITEKMFENASPTVQWIAKRLLNTEGIEEGLENGLDYAADRILGLDPEERFDFDATKQDMLVGWILGTIFNGTLGGEQYDAERIRAVVDEGIEFVQSGMTLDEATQIALNTTKEDVVVKAGKTDEKAPQAEEQYNLSGENGLTYSALSPEAQAGTEPNAEAQLPDTIPQNTKATDLKRGGGQVSYDGATVDGVTYAPVDTANLTRTQKNQINALEAVAKATGANIVFFQSNINEKGQYVGANGFYKNGTVYLDVNAGLESRTADGSTVGEVAIVRTASHELTHFIQEFDQAEYETMRDYVLGTLAEQSGVESIEDLIQQKMDRDASGQLTREEAIDEVIADGCEMMLKDSKAIERLAVEQPSLATRIRDWIRNWAASIRAAFEGIGATHKEAQILMDHADRLQAMWDAALENAARNNRTESGNTNGQTQYMARENMLTDEDLDDYLKTGTRQNKSKQRALDKGQKILLTSEQEIRTYIRESIRSGRSNAPAAYGRVDKRLVSDVLAESNGAIDLTGKYEELNPYDLQHSYEQHHNPKEPGDVPLYEEDYENIPQYLENYDEVVFARTYASNKTSLCVSKKLEQGRIMIIEIASQSRNSIQFKNAIGVSEAKYQNEVLPENGKSPVSSRGSQGQSQGNNISLRLTQAQSGNNITQNTPGIKGGISEPDYKENQYRIIQDNNASHDDSHTWIRSAEEIKSFSEAMHDPDYEGQDITPDFTWKMVQQAEASGEVTVYSSNKIREGVFVTPSIQEAKNYAGGGQIYSKTIPLDHVAWIDAVEGQYTGDARKSERESAVKVDPQNASEEAFVTVDGKQEKIPAVRYSLRSMRHDVQDGKMFDDLAKHTNMNTTEIENLRSGLNHLMDVITLNRDILDMNETYGREDRPFKPYKPNSDPLYTISLDFSTLCRKRLMTQYVIEKLQTELTDSETGKRGRALSAEEQLAVRDLMKEYAEQDKALKVACAMCYVEAARLKAPKQITKFIRDPESAMLRYFALKNKDFNASVKEAQADFKEKHGYDRKAAKKDMKPADVRALNSLSNKLRNSYGDQAHPASAEELEAIRIAKTLPNETYLTAANLAKLAEEHPVIYDAYTATIRTATRSKSLEADIPYYYGDSQGAVSDEFIRSVNAENGMRFSSWSDFQIQHMLDMMTAVIELGSRNTSMHGYTKFLEQVRIFGKTGMMFNMSGVPQGTGLKADGSLDFSPTESVLVHSEDGSEYDAIRARDEFPETAGLQCIGISPDHIKALLSSDIIDYIIPYHTSGLNASLRRMAQISNWDDFTAFQNAAEDKSIRFDPAIHDKETWHKEPVFSEFFNAAKDPANGYQEGEPGIVTMRRAADLYKTMCAERGLKPKFSWGNSKVNADFSNDPNYWKLLIDRKMINQKTGQLIEQKPVRPDFDFGLIEDMVQEAVDSYDPTLQDRALAYVRDHFSELPKRISDLKKSGAVKKAVANSKKVDELTRSFNELQAGVVAAATAGNLKGENGQTKSPQFQLRENGTGRIPWRNNPFFDSGTGQNQQSDYDAQNPFGAGTQNNAQNGAGAQGASQGTNIPPENQNANTEGSTGTKPVSGKEKVSQFFSNTLLKREDAGEFDPITYRTKSDSETLANAVGRLRADVAGEVDGLLVSGAWTDEQVHMGRAVGRALLADARKTGDMTAYRMWRDLEASKIRETARGLRAVALEGNPGAEDVLRETEHIFSDLRKAGDSKISETQIAEAQQQTDEVVQSMLDLEEREQALQDSGNSNPAEEQTIKNGYLDLADRLNAMRNTGLFQDAGKNRAARSNPENVGKLNTKFRKMLGNQDLDYIKRFVACQATGRAEDLNYKGKQDVGKRLNTFQKLAQLTGTGTWLRNFSGNASFGLIDLLANNNPVTLISDQILSAMTGKRSTGWEWGAAQKGTLKAAAQGLERSILEVAANIDLAESSDSTKYDLSRTRTFDPNGNLVNRALSRWEQWNGYMLTSTDKMFRGGIEKSSEAAIRGANERRGYKVSDEEVKETADQVADFRLFQNEGKAAKAADRTRDLFNLAGIGGEGETHKGGFGLGTALMPYTKVPTNIGVKALEFSPAGAVKGLAEMIKTGVNSRNGTATMAQQNQAVTDFGRGVTGTALIVGLAMLMKNAPFFKDWENEDDKNVKAQNKAEGKSGIQFNIDLLLRAADGDKDTAWRNGDHTIDISSIEPLNQLLTAASLIAEEETPSIGGAANAFFDSAKDNFMGLPSVQAIANIENSIRYTDTPEEGWKTVLNTIGSTAGGVVGGFIPAPIRHAAAAADPMQRDTSGNNAMERTVNQVKAGIPWLRETLPVKTDNFGREMGAGDTATRIATTYGGNRYTQIDQSDVSREVERIREETGESLLPSRTGPSSVKFGDEKIKLTASERKEWKDELGKAFDRTMQLAMRTPVYRNATPEDQAELVNEYKSYTEDGVKGKYAADHGKKFESQYADVRGLDNPVSYLTLNKQFNLAEKAGQYDVIDSLLGPIGEMPKGDQEVFFDKNSEAKTTYHFLTPGKDGFKVSDAETFATYQEGIKAHAAARGKDQASGDDIYQEILQGYNAGTYRDSDVDALMRFHYTQSDGDESYNPSKGRYSAYSAMRDNGFSVNEALIFWDLLDADNNGYIKKAERKAAFDRIPRDKRKAVEASFNAYYNKK